MFKKDLDDINIYMRNKDLSKDLRVKIVNYLEY